MWKLLKKYFMPEYVSELDQFLQDFNRKNPDLSKSQRDERDKYCRINQLRDGEQSTSALH